MPSEETYIEIIKSKNKIIEICKAQINFLQNLTINLSKENTIVNNNIETNTMAKNESNSDRNIEAKNYYDQNGQIGNGHISGGEFKNTKIAAIINEVEQKNISEATKEIHELLEQLSKTYPTNTNQEKIIVASKVADEIENNPILKTKTIKALEYLEKEDFIKIINHSLASILMLFIEG